MCDSDDIGVIAILAVIFFGGVLVGFLVGNTTRASERPIPQFELQLLKMNVSIIDAKQTLDNTIELKASDFLDKLQFYNCSEVYRQATSFGWNYLAKYYFVPQNEQFYYITDGRLPNE